MLTSDIFAIGSKNDIKLKTDLNANELLVKDFKDKARIPPDLMDCRNRTDVKLYLTECVAKHVTKLHPDIVITKRDPKELRVEEERVTNEPKLLPKKDDGCCLI